MLPAERYFAAVDEVLATIRRTQIGAIERAADLIVDAVAADRAVYVFGCTHSSIMVQELVYRAGGLALVNPLLGPGLDIHTRPLSMTTAIERLEGYGTLLVEHSPIRQGDVLIVASVSGRNAVPIEVAIGGKKRGARLVVLTSVANSSAAASRHSSGKRLFEIDHDVLLDYCCPQGDAGVSLPNLPVKTGGTSTIAGAYILNSVIVTAIAKMLERGVEPPVFLSANIDGGDEHNMRMLERLGHRVTYL